VRRVAARLNGNRTRPRRKPLPPANLTIKKSARGILDSGAF
jgi:hypothetical protein